MNFLKRLKRQTFSRRSQGSYQREATLRKQLRSVDDIISRCQRVADSEQAQIDQLSRNSLTEGWPAALIPKHLSKIQEQKGQIAVFEPQRERIRAQIDALVNPSPEEARQRAETQTAVAELALKRLEECDRRLADLIRTAGALLEKRAEMTNQIWGLGQNIDFQFDPTGMDERTLNALKIVVGCELEASAEKWVDWLLGERQETERYVVCDDRIVFAETLASPNIYKRGDQVDLTAEEVAEIRSTEETRRRNIPEKLAGGAIRAGESIEIRHARIQKVVEAGQ